MSQRHLSFSSNNDFLTRETSKSKNYLLVKGSCNFPEPSMKPVNKTLVSLNHSWKLLAWAPFPLWVRLIPPLHLRNGLCKLFTLITGRGRQVLWGKLRQGLNLGPVKCRVIANEGRSRQLSSLQWNYGLFISKAWVRWESSCKAGRKACLRSANQSYGQEKSLVLD